MNLPDAFTIFHDRVALSPSTEAKVTKSADALRAYLAGHFDVPVVRVFVQGSFANGTAVEPEDADVGEYDVDIVCDGVAADVSATDALDEIEATLAAHGSYAKLLKGEESRKKPCVRLFYAPDDVGAFHIDVVPARRSSSDDPHAPLEVPRRGEGWHDTAPTEYTQWCVQQGERFARTVRMLKRWREINQDARKHIKSIVLQVLAATNLDGSASDAEALTYTLEAIRTKLATSDKPPVVSNPVMPRENLAALWTQSDYTDFRKTLDEAVEIAGQALNSTDEAEAHRLWRQLLGSDFPEPKPSPGGKRAAFIPATPPPGHHRTQGQPQRERYG